MIELKRVLIVDDSRLIHEDYRKILGRHVDVGSLEELDELLGENVASPACRPEFDVDDAYQGAEGLAMVQKALKEGRPYAVAFVDMRMPPGWDGLETTVKLLEADPEIQIVICTAYSDYSWSDIAAKLGQSDRTLILKKPFETVEVGQLALSLSLKWGVLTRCREQMEMLEKEVLQQSVTKGAGGELKAGFINLQLQPNRRILVVDDIPQVRDDYRKILVEGGGLCDQLVQLETELFDGQSASVKKGRQFQIVEADSGEAAVEAVRDSLARNEPFAVTFMDIRMGNGIDGVQALKQMQEIDPTVEAVLCTAYSDYSWDALVEALGSPQRFLVLKKPFESIEVAHLAATLTAKWNNARQLDVLHNHFKDLVDLRLLELRRASEEK